VAGEISRSTKMGVHVIKLNRPEKMNAISHQMWLDLSKEIEACQKDKDTKGLFISTAIRQVFSVGADLEEFDKNRKDTKWLKDNYTAMKDALKALEDFPFPTVASVSGHCVGAGVSIALACDMRFAEVSAKLSIPPAKLGLVYPFPDIKRLVDAVGHGPAAEILYSAKTIDARDARWMGLVNEVYAREEFDSQMNQLAASLAKFSKTSLEGMKTMLVKIRGGQTAENKDTEKMFLDSFHTEDFEAALKAFQQHNKEAAERARQQQAQAPQAAPADDTDPPM